MNPEKFLLLYSNCLPVKGISRSVVVDTQRSQMFFIDNMLFDLLSEARQKKWGLLLDEYDEESQKVIGDMLDFLEKNDLCFWASDPELFPEIDLEWDAPALITNAIIDWNSRSTHDYPTIFKSLAGLGCRDIQLRFYEEVETDRLLSILYLLEDSYIKSVEFIVRYKDEYTKEFLNALVDEHTKIKTITVHSSPRDDAYRISRSVGVSGMGTIMLVRQEINSSSHCGLVSSDYFTFSTVQTFAEFKSFNSCLNRKVGIDVEGNIKNCPSMDRIFGNINTDRIEDAIDEKFKSLWHINKDQIAVCKVCEFRYVCSDCRAFTKDPRNLFDKPLKCRYDPYKMEWS